MTTSFLAPISVVLLVVLVACSDASEPQQPFAVGHPEFAEATTTNQIISFVADDVQPCTGEPVQWTGELHLMRHVTQEPDGSQNSETRLNTQHTEAQGLNTGVRYVARQESEQALQDIPPGSTVTFESDFQMIRTGETSPKSGDDFMGHSLLHVTVNADGTVTVSNLDFRAECR